jgi:hypothetical protein
MSTSIPAGTRVGDAPRADTGRRRRLKPKRRLQPAAIYAILFGVLVVLAIVAQLVIHMARTEPRDMRAIAERELTVNTLAPGEKVYRMVSVFRRPAIDYFRATRGLLVLTNKRLLYLGLQPRDLLSSEDVPPTFEERDFPIDTLVTLKAGRTFFSVAHALIVETPNGGTKLGVPSESWPSAKMLIVAMDARHNKAVAEGVRQKQLRAKAEGERRAADAERRKPKYYTVRRGDALASIALQWNTTPDMLRQWNHLPDNRIRVGQTLMVKPQT